VAVIFVVIIVVEKIKEGQTMCEMKKKERTTRNKYYYHSPTALPTRKED